MARFHRAVAHVLGPAAAKLPSAEIAPLGMPATKAGQVPTDGDAPADTPIPDVQDWVTMVRG